MHERLINFSLTQWRFICLAWLVLMCSALYAFRHVVC